jgi:DNA-directed RNA polymerase II subunit RPB4
MLCSAHTLIAHNRILRREPELTQFETAQIANLCPADAEEAKSIIPRCVIGLNVLRVLSYPSLFANCYLFYPHSLVKIEDDRLQALLDEIQAMRKFQT